MPRRRTRTTSLLSVSSTTSFRSLLETSMTPPASPTVSEQSNTYYASFSPMRSATSHIKALGIPYHGGKTVPQSRRRRVTFKETVSLESSEDEDDDSVMNVPFIARTHHHHHSRLGPVKTILVRQSSGSSSSSSSSLDISASLHRRAISQPCHRSHAHCSEDDVVMPPLHPILSKLEKSSRFCTQTVSCSTCGKPGQDYPRCSKCGELWCSRSCRLVGGKRHVCPSQ